MRWPDGGIPAGMVTSQPAVTMDLTATILSAAGVPLPKDQPFDGIDLLPIFRGEQAQVDERTFCWRVDRSRRKMKAIRHGDWKYVKDDMVEMRFNLKDDIGEHNDLCIFAWGFLSGFFPFSLAEATKEPLTFGSILAA